MASIEFGLFDHVTRPPGAALDGLYEQRLALLRKADAAGFRGYHLAEHHGHGLSATPSQALFLSAVARETERLRLGLLVACLPLHHPIRLVEEICMLDQLSGGRVDLGVGRGSRRSSIACSATTPTRPASASPRSCGWCCRGSPPGGWRARDPGLRVPRGRRSGRCSARTLRSGPRGTPRPRAQRPQRRVGPAGDGGDAAPYDELWAGCRRAADRLNPPVGTPSSAVRSTCDRGHDAEARRIGERALDVLGGFLARSVGREPPHLQDPDRPDPPNPLVRARSRAPGVLVCGTAETVRDHYVRYAAEGT